MEFLKEYFEKDDFEKNQQMTKSMKNFPGGKELMPETNYRKACAYKKVSEKPAPTDII